MRTEKWLTREAAPARRSMSASIALGLAAGLLAILQAWLLARTADGVIFAHRSLADLAPILWRLAAVVGARALVAWAAERAAFASASSIKSSLRDALFSHVQALGPVFLRGARSGEIAALIADGVEAVEVYSARYVPQRAVAALVPLAVLALVFPQDLFSGFFLLGAALAVPLLMIVIGGGAEALNRRQWGALTRMSGRFLDMIQGMTTMKLFGASRREAQEVQGLSDEYRRSSMAVMRVAFLSAFMLELFSTVSIAVVAISIGLRLMAGEMLFRHGYFILLLAPELFLPLRSLGGAYHARMNALAASEKIAEVMETPAPRWDGIIPFAPTGRGVTITIEAAHFSYGASDAEALAGVSLVLRPGTRAALVGPSGAGKSTLVSLLLGFLKPSTGRILVDGLDLADVTLESWRRAVTWMPQRAHLFFGTILDNIRLGAPEATAAQVIEAARRAHAHRFISELPQGYETLVGEAGAGLSGGEVQRVALARAFLKDAPVILLDEAGAHMDSVSERELRAGIEELSQGRTLLTVAHRLSTAESADEILVLDRGRLVQQGTHAELAAADGVYARMCAAWGPA
jgi:ATP-binding cassette, subfamily C, bacterial CydD